MKVVHGPELVDGRWVGICDECGARVHRADMALSDTEPARILAYELFPCGHNATCVMRAADHIPN